LLWGEIQKFGIEWNGIKINAPLHRSNPILLKHKNIYMIHVKMIFSTKYLKALHKLPVSKWKNPYNYDTHCPAFCAQ